MRIEYDKEADIAYVYVADLIREGEAATQVLVEADELRGDVVLDLDENGFLIGIEILGASRVLRPAQLGR
ncbi:DUF2283 domain-containing protein [Nonomuraea deserti]|uniref:DUF2283 domain-containing protein n=1 Tax=Nonomuraea deserti TaxID=1848322 RepID=UPI0014042DBB|nr:DUF2283 domain-containing protein [Nonomuraea deserti]